LKKNPLRDLRRVTEHPKAQQEVLEAEDSQEGIQIFSIYRRRKKDKIP
jgi:hypothetical protein